MTRDQVGGDGLGENLLQVWCTYQYLQLVDSDHYTFLSPEDLRGWRTVLSPSYNSVLVSCMRSWGWTHQLLLKFQVTSSPAPPAPGPGLPGAVADWTKSVLQHLALPGGQAS